MIISLYKYPLSSKNTQKVCETEFFTQFNDIYYFPVKFPKYSHTIRQYGKTATFVAIL